MPIRNKKKAKPKVKAKPEPQPNTEQPRKSGRPSSYKDEFAVQAEKLCKLGATDAELADFFGVTTVTIWRWQSSHEAFCNALKRGKDVADDRVERSLYHRAVGYTFDSEKVFQFQGEIVRAETTEHVPPDTTACIFWLKNRRNTEWRDKQEVDTTNTIYRVSDRPMTEEEWAAKHVTDD